MKRLLVLLLPFLIQSANAQLASDTWSNSRFLAKEDSAAGYVTHKALNDAIAGVQGGSLPAGIIVMWSGTLANIPSGWHICDGTEGTPDLRDKFVKGAASGQNPGATGGDSLHTPAGTVSQPTLTMNAYTPQGTNAAPTLTMNPYTPAGTINAHTVGAKAGTSGSNVSFTAPTTHTFTGTQATLTGSVAAPGFTGTEATLTGSVSAPTFSGAEQNTEPVYYALAFIMKQ